MTNPLPKLILLPGLGTDGRLFDAQRAAIPDLYVPPWIPHHNKDSLGDYAARMAVEIDKWLKEQNIERYGASPASLHENQGSPKRDIFILGGVSLGGMLAYEIARHIKPSAVVQIASCRTRKGVNGFLRAAGNIWPVVPTGAMKVAKFVSLPVLRTFGLMEPAQRKLCATMFSEMDSLFMRWAVSAILKWNPEPLEDIPVFQIHGARDQIIPAKFIEADELIPDGGHLINLTQAEAVNAFLRDILDKSIISYGE
jgi:pimeloyl-ACP methyl ester carboxylesterase